MSDFPGEAQAWADNHHELSRSASNFYHGVMCAFGVLNRAQYDAPWLRSRKTRAR